MFKTKYSEEYKTQRENAIEYEKTFAGNNREARKQMLEKEGKVYRNRWSRFFLFYWELIAIFFFFIGIIETVFVGTVHFITVSVGFTMIFLPFVIVCMLLNLVAGRELAVFQKDGFWCLRELERSQYLFENKEALVYIPYNCITGISYTGSLMPLYPASTASRQKGKYASVVVYANDSVDEIGRFTPNTYVLRCSARTKPAKVYAKHIAKHTNVSKIGKGIH